MAVKTGATAQLQIKSGASYITVAKVRDITLNFNRDALETTGIGEKDRTYAYGIRGTSGSGTLLYDSTDSGTQQVLNHILSDAETLSGVKIVLDTGSSNGTITGDALITATGASVSVGDLISVPISFSMSGKPTGTF
jgi:predicted secreted protein